jgi:Tfp pilus assembly protein PilZ
MNTPDRESESAGGQRASLTAAQEELSQRRNRRVELKVGVRISTIDPETDPHTGRPYFRTSEETCANVSRGGAYVETEETIAPGRRLLLELDLPDGDRVQTVGRVAWTKTAVASAVGAGRRFGMGIEFLGGRSEELRRLEAFIDDSAKSAEPAGAKSTATEPEGLAPVAANTAEPA